MALIRNIFRPFHRLFYGAPRANPEITDKLIEDCVGRKAPVILEIGCNDGGSTLRFLNIFESPEIYCFEPDPRAIARFKKNIDTNASVQLFELALSDRVGDISFYESGGHKNEQQLSKMPEGWDLSGSIKRPKKHLTVSPWVKFDRVITVKTTTLDSWSKEQKLENIDFIWMDVQGAEMDVFREGRETLAKTRFIYTEYSNDELYEGQSSLSQLLEQLESFEILIKYPRDVLLRNKKFDFHPGKVLRHELRN